MGLNVGKNLVNQAQLTQQTKKAQAEEKAEAEKPQVQATQSRSASVQASALDVLASQNMGLIQKTGVNENVPVDNEPASAGVPSGVKQFQNWTAVKNAIKNGTLKFYEWVYIASNNYYGWAVPAPELKDGIGFHISSLEYFESGGQPYEGKNGSGLQKGKVIDPGNFVPIDTDTPIDAEGNPNEFADRFDAQLNTPDTVIDAASQKSRVDKSILDRRM